jgi:hypothetical protein
MDLSIPHAEHFAAMDSWAVLRALSRPSFLTDPTKADTVKKLNSAREEMERAGPLGLTVSFSEVKMLEHAEGLLGKWFGASSEFYIITTVIDGSGKPFEYKTQFFEGIKRNDHLPLGEGGMLVSYLRDPKWFVDLHMIVMESDSDLRDLGERIEKAKEQAGLADLLELAGAAASLEPTLVSKVVNGVDLFLHTLTYLLKENGDDHVATVHDFYLQPQAFGKGRHPSEGTTRFQGIELAYEIRLTQL